LPSDYEVKDQSKITWHFFGTFLTPFPHFILKNTTVLWNELERKCFRKRNFPLVNMTFYFKKLYFNVVFFLRITTLLTWLKSTLLLKNKCFDTTIYMKTQCIQTNEMQHYWKGKCLRSDRWSRERVVLIKSLIYKRWKWDTLEAQLPNLAENVSWYLKSEFKQLKKYCGNMSYSHSPIMSYSIWMAPRLGTGSQVKSFVGPLIFFSWYNMRSKFSLFKKSTLIERKS
jgi:hypothetical protein